MSELSIQQKELITQLKTSHPELAELSDAQILSVLNSDLDSIKLSEEEKVSLLSLKEDMEQDGLKIEKTGNPNAKPKLSPEDEEELKKILKQRLNDVGVNLDKAQKSNGFLGNIWGGIKNFTGIGDSSEKVWKARKEEFKSLKEKSLEDSFKDITGLDYTEENLQKFLDGEIQTKSEIALAGYAEGQEMAADTMADLVSGILSFGIYVAAVAAAPVTGGASIALGVAAATAMGAGIKVGIKALDTLGSDRKYTSENLKRDLATGGFSGLLSPITGGVGSVVGKSVAKTCGLQVMKQVGKELVEEGATYGVKQGIKSALVNAAGFEYVGGKLIKRALAYGAEMATDGALGGAIDNAFRTYYDGGDAGDVANAAVQGFVGGATMAPVIGGGMRGTGKIARNLFGKTPDIEVRKSKLQENYDKRSLRRNGCKTGDISENVTEINIELAEKFLEIRGFCPDHYTSYILRGADTPEKVSAKVDFINRINSKTGIFNRRYRTCAFDKISMVNNPQMADLVEKVLSMKEYLSNISFRNTMDEILYIMSNKEAGDVNFELLSKLLSDEKFNKRYELQAKLQYILQENNPKEILELYDKFVANIKIENERLFDMYLSRVLLSESSESVKLKIEIIDKVFADENMINNEVLMKNLPELLNLARRDYCKPLVEAIIADEKLYSNPKIMEMLVSIDFGISPASAPILLKILSDEKLYNDEKIIENLLSFISKGHYRKSEEIDNILKLLDFYAEKKEIIQSEKFEKAVFDILKDSSNKDFSISFLQKIIANERLCNDSVFMNELPLIVENINSYNALLIERICLDENWPKEGLGSLASALSHTSGRSLSAAEKILADTELDFWEKCSVLDSVYSRNSSSSDLANFIDEIYESNILIKQKEQIFGLISSGIIKSEDRIKNAIYIFTNLERLEIPPERIGLLLSKQGEISPKQLKNLSKILGKNNFDKLSNSDIVIAIKVIGLHGITSINEIPISAKKNVLRALVDANYSMFRISDELKRLFPLIPRTQNEYCTLIPALVRSLGIETNPLKPAQIVKFNESLDGLSSTLAKISDDDFANLRIYQEYSKDDFIKNVLNIVKDLPKSEQQKVYDYFGFELHHNSGNEVTGYSISGYPVNLNNGKKLAEITEPKTKEIVELLRPEVVRFSQNNAVKCNNFQVEKLLNDIVEALPELRVQIGKKQHGTHDFDILQHSLKVLQKIAQDPQFKALRESDKKVVALAALLHDITKIEGVIDKTHATEGAFDAFYIARKFNLSREEEIKLYTLAKHHEWLEYVNTSQSEEELVKRLQSVAYDLRNDNLFDLVLMFTHADLRAVKKNNTFHDTVDGKSRLLFDGKTRRSYGESAEVYARRIREYVLELKKTQPLLPVTQVPTASRIAQAIKTVNPDGSTNIKGVYKDSDGLVIIKFNEVEDWEVIGFPKGTTTKGIKASSGKNLGGEKLAEDIDTGNLHFFAHGIDYENQLVKFDAFSLPDSDALLSISYAERPESKYRFFRAQGVLLDFETKYVHGGGDSDAGSGYGKSIADFKEYYIFGGYRENERIFISDLIKKEFGMTDDEYVQFISENENKPFTEIYPIEFREKLIQLLASINSNERNGIRSYNEMYGSNPRRVMGVFAYSMNYIKKIGNPVNFLNNKTHDRFDSAFGSGEPVSVYERTEFLRRYALGHDIPFFVFGD